MFVDDSNTMHKSLFHNSIDRIRCSRYIKLGILLLIPVLIFIACDREKKTLFNLTSSKSTGLNFNNRIVETDSSNILNNEYIFNGGGVAVGDFNNDSLPDIFFTGNQVANALYLNKGQLEFKDVSATAGISAEDRWSTGVALTDINNDGWLDAYVCSAMLPDETKRANMLFVNQGLNKNNVPVFKEMAKQYGIAEKSNSMGATFLDYDKDGLLDLYVLNNEQVHTLPTNYRPKIVDGSAVSNDRLFHNNGDGTFTDVTLEAGIVYEGFGLGIAVADFNSDGWPDIHVSNDYITNDVLYINNTDGTFSNRIEDYIKHQSRFSMGSDVADYNNDGFLDLITLDMLGETNYRMKTTLGDNNYMAYVLNERYEYQYQYMRNMLHKGNGAGLPHSEIGLMTGISKTDWSWSPLFADFDNDGHRDLFITNGFPRDITDKDFGDFNLSVHQYLSPAKILDSIPVVKIPNYAFKNQKDFTFKDVSKEWGLDIPSFSNGAVFADLDRDGDLDYVVNNINEEAFLFENNTNTLTDSGNFLRIRLKGPEKNPMGIGAKIVLRQNEGELIYHEQFLTRGYMSSVEPIVHFGLGKQVNISSLEILWPDGRFEKIQSIKPNSTISLTYDDAKAVDGENLMFPFVPKRNNPLMEEVSKQIGIEYLHREADVVDYNVQRILPHKLTQNGPCLAVGDINGDAFEDFIVGSSSDRSPIIFFQNSEGNFKEKQLFDTKEDRAYEEESMALFDLENDGDLDLYIVSGSNEFEPGSELYNDRLFVNDGAGNFTDATDKMPLIKASGSVVKAADFNQDGFIDLFVGGRTPMGQYPLAEESFLLKNDKGTLKNVTDELAQDLKTVGMINDAVWADFNSDGHTDLVVLGELMPIIIFQNDGKKFKKIDKTGIENLTGWWESIVAEDLDQDGDIDFIAGNMGENNFFQPSTDRPVTVKAKDFDNNGSIDPITFAYFKGKDGPYDSYPVHFWGDISKQSTMFRSKFNYYKEYAQSTEKALLSKEELKGTLELKGNYDKTSFIENTGNGQFKAHELPFDAQMAPINDILLEDVTGDGKYDIIGVGNNFGNETFIGRQDGLNGLILKLKDSTKFETIPSGKSGFLVPGDAKSISKIKGANGEQMLIVTQNRDSLLVFRY